MSRSPLSARPLLDTSRDADLFVPLGQSVDELVHACDRGLTVLVHGVRGSGRTTLLRALLRRRRTTDGPPTVFVQAALATTPGEVLHACLEALPPTTDTPPNEGAAPSTPPAPMASPASVASPIAPPPSTARAELAELRRRCASRPVTFLVDNLDPHVAHRLFGLGRDDLWEVDASFVVTALDEDLPIVLAPPADAFFEARVAVPPPPREEAAGIRARRLGRDVEIPDPPPTPRALLEAARRDPEDPASADAARARRLDAAAALGPSALEVARLLEEVGSVSAADEDARKRLGVSAARLSQVLAQMYDGGLVSYDDVRAGGPGRPRRRYHWARVVGGGIHPDEDEDDDDAAASPDHPTPRTENPTTR